MSKPKIAVVGAGKVGSALALLLSRQGYPVAGVASKGIASARRVADELKVPATVNPEEVTKVRMWSLSLPRTA